MTKSDRTNSDRTNSDRTNSAIYEGLVDHDRLRPRRHRFRYGMAYLYLDLDELPGVLDVHPLWSARRPAPAWFREADYFGRGAVPLAGAVRDAIEGHSGERPTGPIRLLTLPRTWGQCFNPVSFYYVFAPDGTTLRWFLADVSNTFDIVLANILAPTLVALAPDLKRVLAPGGRMVVSGILADAHQHVLDALAPLQVERVATLDGWAAVTLR